MLEGEPRRDGRDQNVQIAASGCFGPYLDVLGVQGSGKLHFSYGNYFLHRYFLLDILGILI